jgi:hypothetical protein
MRQMLEYKGCRNRDDQDGKIEHLYILLWLLEMQHLFIDHVVQAIFVVLFIQFSSHVTPPYNVRLKVLLSVNEVTPCIRLEYRDIAQYYQIVNKVR